MFSQLTSAASGSESSVRSLTVAAPHATQGREMPLVEAEDREYRIKWPGTSERRRRPTRRDRNSIETQGGATTTPWEVQGTMEENAYGI